jgi:hypothetical protein
MPVPKPLRMTNTVAVQSSLLASVAYDNRRAILQVTLRNGASYQYTGVPVKTYQGLLQANSKGVFFNHCIRGLYPYKALPLDAPAASGGSLAIICMPPPSLRLALM